ncbi:P-loop containing nucleoside triphosphate hydrolase protein [Gymnopilus junonius]|uniref:ATP-dependent RNA helicase n=1 Tax=Gymnopilus junonius TaxID=109634 RepID=A0A9P5TQ76_GYMJU|nr:P-loop containing nucleoside triphosphate hydrolase protein [Gymnopilus junonius]
MGVIHRCCRFLIDIPGDFQSGKCSESCPASVVRHSCYHTESPPSSWALRLGTPGRQQQKSALTALTQNRFASTATVTTSPVPDTPVDPEKTTPDASLSFQSLADKIHPNTLRAITVAPFKYTHMSAVQAQILPLLPQLADPYDASARTDSEHPRDLLVKAKTGTGKTMAFLVPAIESRLNALEAHAESVQSTSSVPLSQMDVSRAQTNFARKSVGTLIISPTRELATQIAVEASNLTAHHRGFQVQILLGGESKFRQMREWSKGRKDIVVATPGRLLDLINTEPEVHDLMKSCKMLILDEADTLLDMGFREDITRISSYLAPSPERQTFLFSATVSRQIQQIAQSTLDANHRFVNCVSADDSPVHAHIPQYHTVLRSGEELLPHLIKLIALDQLQHQSSSKRSKVVIFLSTTNSVMLFSQLLRKAIAHLPLGRKTNLYEMHAKREMKTRTRVSNAFRNDTYPSIMVTSDVSARGVDYPGVTRVIQVGLPSGKDIYIHRVGRTGRGSNKQGRGDLVLMPWEMIFVHRHLRDVALKPVTSTDLTTELAELAAAHPQHKYDELKIGEIPKLSQELTSNLSTFAPDDISGAFSSQLGFFIGRARELGLDMHEMTKGLQKTWQEMWALDREPTVSRKLMEMMSGGGGFGSGRGGWGNRDRDRGSSGGGSRGGWSSDRSGGYGGGGGGGYRSNDRSSGSSYHSFDRGDRSSGSSSRPYTGSFSSRGSPGGNDGYGYTKGSRQGFTKAKQWPRTHESGWEMGGVGPRGDRGGDRGVSRAPWLGRGSRSGGGSGSRSGGDGWRNDID